MAVEEGIAWYVHGASRFVLSVALVWFWLHVSKPSHDEPDEWWFEWYVDWSMENVLPAFAIQCVLRFANECWQGRGAIAGGNECVREAKGVVTDLSSPVFAVLASPWQTWRSTYEQVLESLARFGTYVQGYGLIGNAAKTNFTILPYTFYFFVVQALVAPIRCTLLFMVITFAWWQFYQVVAHGLLHRFFSHRAFSASRPVTLVLGMIACIVGQRGPLWWASTHRRHHKHCETEHDPHCPGRQGFLYAHVGWVLDRDHYEIRLPYVRDWLMQRPELLLVDAFRGLIMGPFLDFAPLAVTTFVTKSLGMTELIENHWPDFNIHAPVTAFGLSLHFTYLVNSWTHSWDHPKSADKEQELETTAKKTTAKEQETTAELDVHGDKQAAHHKPCQGVDVTWVGYLNGGDGFHGRHHAEANLAQNAPHWWQDLVYMTICVFERVGLVYGVQRRGSSKWKAGKAA